MTSILLSKCAMRSGKYPSMRDQRAAACQGELVGIWYTQSDHVRELADPSLDAFNY